MRVSEVTAIITARLDTPELTNIKVSGEITNFKRHSSGHLYFSLSERLGEKEYVIRCTIWKSAARYLPWTPVDGMVVEAYGTINHYERSGQYTLIISQMWQSGAGEKALLIEKWKRELSQKGFFSMDRKRQLPAYPERIGVVTSETGAVIHDIQNVISCRFPVEIILSPTVVQGLNAPEEIAKAIRCLAGKVDVIIVGRGGGSYEDLFAFNNPVVVEAIATCPVPVIAAIGHEVDITLADLAADHRASTPSHAAELAVKDKITEIELIQQIQNRIFRRLLTRIEQADEEVNDLRERLSPFRMERILAERRQYLVDLSDRMADITDLSIKGLKIQIREFDSRLKTKNPIEILIREIPQRKERVGELKDRLNLGIITKLTHHRMELSALSQILEAKNPYGACKEGYCIVRHDGQIVSSIGALSTGDSVELTFRDGTATADITEVNKHEKV